MWYLIYLVNTSSKNRHKYVIWKYSIYSDSSYHAYINHSKYTDNFIFLSVSDIFWIDLPEH